MILFSGGCLYVTNLIENSILSRAIGLDLWVISAIIFALSWFSNLLVIILKVKNHHISQRHSIFDDDWTSLVNALYL